MFNRISRGIYWDRIWRLTAGCTHVSEGCLNCWSEKESQRRARTIPYQYGGVQYYKGKWNGNVRLLEKNLSIPGYVRKKQAWLVLNDLFHPQVTESFILTAFSVMEQDYNQVFFVLTKRPERMAKLLNNWEIENKRIAPHSKHIYLGTSIEDQATADERIPHLLDTPAAVRWLSVEPMLGPIDLRLGCYARSVNSHSVRGQFIHGVICGAESGPGARPVHPDWVRSLRDQCQAAGVPFFFKQWGEWAPKSHGFKITRGTRWGTITLDGQFFETATPFNGHDDDGSGEAVMVRVGKKAAGRMLDGRPWDELPDGRDIPF